MRSIVLVLLFVVFSSAKIISPYESLNKNEKLDILVNHFLNEELATKIPKKPEKRKPKDASPINAKDYERYYNYIQRLKNIKEERAQEAKEIEQEYHFMVSEYNSKVDELNSFYSQEKNIHPLIQKAINKSFKILYGKPMLKKLSIDEKDGKIYGVFYIEDIYGYNKIDEKKIVINVPQKIKEQFYFEYRAAKLFVNFSFENDILKFKDLTVLFRGNEYKADFFDDTDSFLLKIRVNKSLFDNVIIKKD